MSAAGTHHDPHDHVHGHPDGEAHGSFKGYMTGFVLSVILTAIPFWLVMGNVLADKQLTTFIILGFAAVQVIVHMIFFLHMNSSSEGGWNMLAMIFTIMVVVITLAGSMWIMSNLNANMMPVSAHEMRNVP